jgi:hypothetical protein
MWVIEVFIVILFSLSIRSSAKGKRRQSRSVRVRTVLGVKISAVEHGVGGLMAVVSALAQLRHVAQLVQMIQLKSSSPCQGRGRLQLGSGPRRASRRQRRIKHGFKCPNRHPKKLPKLDGRDLATLGGGIRTVARQAEVGLSGFGD